MKSALTTRANDRKEIVNFGFTDNRNREIGAEISTYDAIFTELPETACVWHNLEPGYYYGLRCWATRNGRTYGAIQPNQFFRTIAERDNAIAKYLTSAKKRAAVKTVGE
jgi:hypothetical protein